MKFVVAAIYTNYTTEIIDGEDMEQLDGYVAGPKGGKLILQFERAGYEFEHSFIGPRHFRRRDLN